MTARIEVFQNNTDIRAIIVEHSQDKLCLFPF